MIALNAAFAEVSEWLDWAGQTLLAMRLPSPSPRSARASWPVVIPDFEDFASAPRFRPPIPSSAEISLMDEIFTLIEFIPDATSRRIVQARLLVAPLNGKHLYSWQRLGRLLHLDAKTVQARWQRALKLVIASAPDSKMGLIRGRYTALTAPS